MVMTQDCQCGGNTATALTATDLLLTIRSPVICTEEHRDILGDGKVLKDIFVKGRGRELRV